MLRIAGVELVACLIDLAQQGAAKNVIYISLYLMKF